MTHIAPPPPPPPAAAALPPCPAWLREDCCALYRQEFVVTSVNSNCLAVQDRVGLLRVGITLARQVTRRFPDALFLEMGVHEGKDLVRMATFLRSIEERQHYQEQRRRDKRNKKQQPQQQQPQSQQQPQPHQIRTPAITKNYTTFHGFDSFEGLPEDWNNGQFQEVVRVDDSDNTNTNTNNKNNTNTNTNHHTNNNNNTNNTTTTMTQPRREPLHKQGAFDTGGKVPDVAYLVEHYLTLGDHGRTNTHRKYHNDHHNNHKSSQDTTERTLATQNTNTGRSLSQSNSNSVIETIQIHKGWFQDSVPRFFDAQTTTTTTTNTPPVVAFVHADADLYTSTVTFLDVLCARNLLRKGSIIIFDEFWNYPHWQEGEYKAWMDIVTKYGLESKYQYFGYHAPPPATSTAIATDGLTTTTTATNHNHNHKTKRKTTKKKFKHYGYQSVGVVMTSDL